MTNEIRNPFSPSENHCFGCGPGNPIGLRLNFEETDTGVLARWNPGQEYQGYVNVLHGGIIATLLDEVSAWTIYIKLNTAGVTSRLDVRYLNPVHLSKGVVTASAELLSSAGRKATLKCTLTDGESKVCAEAETEFFIFPEEVARRRFMYPGREAFSL